MKSNAGVKFVVPFAAYLLFTVLLKEVTELYAFGYVLIVFLVTAIAYYYLRNQDIVKPNRNCAVAVVFGVLGFGLWILLTSLNVEAGLSSYLPGFLQPAPRSAFNPFESSLPEWGQWSFVVARMFGLGLLVPIIEEVFWRGFIWRWIAGNNWEEQPIGIYSASSFWGVTALFVLAHPEWLAAAIWCLLINLLFCWKKNIWDCIVAHAVTNTLLGIYVVQTGSWYLW